ncbi:hypothetical protein [Streptomyces piniterrae]|uniref:hypothetical protein n=1 Tax=Streptomyces piniterrae TaxID=2571125 RepID=UPI00248259F4|nr:hypothetical protein [Streptomyces piniterrae]
MGAGPRDGGGAGGAGAGYGGGRAGGPGDDAGGEVEALLRERLRLADEQIEMPAGMWARIKEADAGPAPTVVALPRRRPYVVVLAVAAAVAAVMLGVWWLVRPGPAEVKPAGPPSTVPVKVYNSESACRKGRTLECALRLARDPHAEYAARGNSAGRVWHGEVLAARCVVTDGQLVRDEQGVTSTRWYLVSRTDGVEGWLPGVRTRNTREVPVCSADVRSAPLG